MRAPTADADADPVRVPVGGPHQLWVRADIRAGRTAEQKRELLARITREVGEAVGIAPEAVWGSIFDIPGGSVAEYGRPLPDPVHETEWFEELPAALQERLSERR